MRRRNVLKGVAIGLSSLVVPAVLGRGATGKVGPGTADALADLEQRSGGRLGVSMLDTATGRRIGHRGDERFLMCSTFKLLAVAAVLARVDHGLERLGRHVVYDRTVLLDYAPVTSRHLGAPGMTIAELCEAAITLSDNTAANLLLSSMDGPDTVTAFVRGLGDPVTRLDRTEPELNRGSPDDLRDTTTPNAMLVTMHKLLLGSALSSGSRSHLLAWLRACNTGAGKLRAGLPSGWEVGDKTGSGSQGETNDVAIIWPPGHGPLLVTAYYAGSPLSLPTRNAVLARVGRIAAAI
ncbi:MAG: class A beta-lactamase [Pseudomonadota bacterium]|nr:class A beta-lactamase [Pseudomonadota bacterium]